jgi:two-component system chemotaxis response regulator CheY
MPDANLSDWHLPAMRSVEFLASLRGCPRRDKPHVIYCATENNQRDMALAPSSGADDHVLKPFEREVIRSKLAAAGLI